MLIEVDTHLIDGTTVSLPLRGTVDVTVDWGDGLTTSTNAGGYVSHTYAGNGRYTIGITGSLSQFGGGWEAFSGLEAVTAVGTWGDLGLTSLWGAFSGARHLTSVPTTLPSGVSDMQGMLLNAIAFNRDLAGWCVALIPNRPELFDDGATSWSLPRPVWGTCP